MTPLRIADPNAKRQQRSSRAEVGEASPTLSARFRMSAFDSGRSCDLSSGRAITAVEHFDMQQHGTALVGIADTDTRNTSANTLYDNLRTIQGAADIEWPERQPANRSQREKFRLGFFPPTRGNSNPPPTPPVTPPTPPPA